MPRYVVLTHDHPVLHWDFMLENGETLRTWRLSQPPTAGDAITAEPLGDHRRAYLDYEGPVTGSRGEVRRWDAGEYRLLDESPICLKVRLDGATLRGVAAIETSEGDPDAAFYFTAEEPAARETL